jgi:hypothetical protein
MEAIVPLFALGSLYVVNQKQKSKKEGFNSINLPNVSIPDKNYNNEVENVLSNETDNTTKLSTVNKYKGEGSGVYTDKYFDNSGYKSAQNIDNQYTSLTGENVNGSYFEHNNMVPFFGSNLRSAVLDENVNESILDNYTGSGSQDVIKQEQAPLFEPSENYNWAYGAPNKNDFYQSRVNPSHRNANVNPFKQESVAPGLGLGYGTEGGDGFNSGMMNREQWMSKTVDQLRTENNPKPGGHSLIGHEGPAISAIKKVGVEGKFEKNRPDRHYENDKDRWLTTGGLEKGATSRAEQIDRFTNRKEVGRQYEGTAGHYNSGEYIPGKHQEPKTIELGAKPLGVAKAIDKNSPTEGDYGYSGKKAYPNNRSINNETNYFGGLGYSVGAAIAPLLDVLRPSRKENTIGSLRPYQNAKTHVPESYMYDPNNKAKVTHRQGTENSKFHMNVNRNQRGGAYEVSEQQVVNNTRMETGDFYYSGNAGAKEGTQKMKSYQAEYNQRNNEIKSSTINGRLVPGNMKLLNHNVNVAQPNRDNMLKNERPAMGSMPAQGPQVSNLGISSTAANDLYSGIQMERTNGNIMEAIKSNPYALDHKKIFN